MADLDLESVYVQNGVNENGVGFCHIFAHSAGGTILMGQITPTKAREMAMQWLEVAEAAEQDAATLRCIRKLELPDQLAGKIITELRNSREQSQE